ncbi:hypothetical protein RhiirA1_482678 [Rhizophagus irregularis]|uniref:Uncharacterized protein n=1 Tax=Rhizophagus irregularis TaxID=588596 RepID=A0A2N0QLI6_9GLOM|nr:hypothetical protein RhiirA1_482678 [Rhizophagus irregularis]
MPNTRKQIILNEILFWKQNKLLPEHYCDFLMTLYTEGEVEPEENYFAGIGSFSFISTAIYRQPTICSVYNCHKCSYNFEYCGSYNIYKKKKFVRTNFSDCISSVHIWAVSQNEYCIF